KYLSHLGKNPNFVYDSLLGIAFTAPVAPNLETNVQIVAAGASGDGVPAIDWAYAQYRPTDSFSLRAGKLRFPLWLIADYYCVGFAYPWARPPPETYVLG